MWNKIKNLTKIFIKEFYENLNLFNIKNKKVNKKSALFWILSIILITIGFLSYKLIELFKSAGQPMLFLDVYFTILSIVLLFQISMMAVNIFFFSKDLEFVLPMPIKSIELLLAKYNTLLFMSYITMAILGFIPLLIYGLLAAGSLKYYLLMFIVLAIFPILFVTIISIITVFFMNFAKFFKNKNIFQTIVTTLLIVVIFLIENNAVNSFMEKNKLIEEIDNQKEQVLMVKESFKAMHKQLIIVTPCIELLNTDNNILNNIYNIIKALGYNISALAVFILIGEKTYLKSILKGTVSIKDYKKEKTKLKKEKNKIGISYIKKEIKVLFRHPAFFMQTIFPVIFILITAIIIVSVIIPAIDMAMQANDTIRQSFEKISFDLVCVCIILGINQVLFSVSNLSLTAISREGRDAVAIKYLPISLYKQFLYKNVLQVGLDIVVSIVVLGIIYYLIPQIGFINIIIMFIITIFINLINSYLMLIVDLRRPNLNWNSEMAVIKKSENKIFQYGFMIGMILILMYLTKLLETLNLKLAMLIEILIFGIAFILIDRIVKKKSTKIFNKIN